MQKRIIALLLALSLCCSWAFAAETADVSEEQETPQAAETQPDAEGTLSFANLEQRVRENNPSMLALEETIASVEVLDYDKMYEELRDSLNSIASAQWTLSIYGMGDSYTHGQLSQAYSSLKDSFEDLKDGKLQDDNEGVIRQLKNAQNQLVMAAETLYVSLLELQSTRTTLQRSLDALDRTVEEMELRYERGQISALQLEQARSGRTQMKSGLDTLDTNIGLYTAQLETMVGLEPTGTLKLGEVPDITAEQMAAMEYAGDLETAREASYSLYSAAQTLEDAKEDFHDAGKDYGFSENRYQYVSAQHTWQAAQYTYEAAVQSFELSFQSAYAMVGDYRQVLEAAETALALERNTYASIEVKHQQGNLSLNELLDAQDSLAEAEAAVLSAKHDLFTAYQTYWWAVEQGVLN